ncbi:ComEC/Rec2 family competence protein [Nannocystis bainbridge]|uniref:MBL fold metallo-hydrolase n=1 Tax=Nannocystis bainbridge TaxID=2995303 RepID=A0ABT5E4B9_9BACT|nr:MBL fold metallo-hydrolase [Nannocystis bainbridge]MDC0719581.1 MBL fold metallo-hydrolase [Nannocystis bainbridge]
MHPVCLSLSLLFAAPLAPIDVGPGLAPPPPGPGFHFIDAGQGSSLLVVGREGQVVIVDAGPPAASEPILAALAAHELAAVDLWLFSHFDNDHIGGFVRALAGPDNLPGTDDDLELRERWDRGLEDRPDTPAAILYEAAAAPRQTARAGDRWDAPGLSVRVVDAASPPERAAENERGLALCIEVEDLRLLAPGDLPFLQVEAAARACGPVDVLWTSHHGSRSGISQAVLAAAMPSLVVISAGGDNSYCHPHLETLSLLHSHAVWVTDLAGASPHGPCPGLAAVWGPEHRVALADVWLPAGGAD